MADAEYAQDRWTLRPVIAPVATALFVGPTFSFLQLPDFGGAWLWFGLLCGMLGLVALLLWLVARLVHLLGAIWRRMWRSAASQLIALVAVLPLMAAALFIGSYVHFVLSCPYYLWQVMQSPDGGTKRVSFYWGGAGFVGSAQNDRWLVYDPTDETAAEPKLSQRPEDPIAWYEVEHLIGRFYLVQRHQL
jgi:hypothetical protein